MRGGGRWLAALSAVALVSCGGGGGGSRSAGGAADDPRGVAAATGATRLVAAMRGGRGAWQRLAALCDGHGHRLTGSPGLAGAIAWAIAALRADGHQAVRGEPVRVPVWVRGVEEAAIVSPQVAGAAVPMAVLGLGGGVATPPEGLEAEVIRVGDEDELARRRAEVRGRIVLFDNPMPAWTEEHGAGYGHCVRFRVHGARLAAAHGAVAVLVRSVTARSLRTPHTGALHYGEASERLPAAAIATEDADRIARLVASGVPVRVRLRLGGGPAPDAESHNVIAELPGRERPEEIIIVSAHIDSWDVGQGAHDDGAGVAMAMEALAQMRRLGLQPRRTIRLVLWTNEESGMMGVRSYLDRHAAALGRHVAAIEADAGGFAPVGYGVFHDDKRREAAIAGSLEPLLRAVAPVGTIVARPGMSAPDVSRFHPHGVPAFALLTHGERYFDYHHTHADTVDKVDPDELQRAAAALAALTWWLAEVPARP